MNTNPSDSLPLGHLLQANPFLPVGVALDEGSRKQHDELWMRLTAPFSEADIEWLLKEDDVSKGPDGSYCGRAFAYVNARAVQQRLDEVFGMYWSTKQVPASFGIRAGFVCELSVFVPAVGWITKSDACDLSVVEPVRGGASGALKRVAVQFGIGRYLYSLGDTLVRLSESGGTRRLRVDNKSLTWTNPLMPAWALPVSERAAREEQVKALAEKAALDAEGVLKRREAAEAEKAAQVAIQREADAKKFAAEKAEAAARIAAAQAEAARPKSAPPAGAAEVLPVAPPAKVPATAPTSVAPPALAVAPMAEDLAPTNTPEQARFGGLSAGQVSRLNEILGSDTPLILSVLKHKKMLPLGATSIEQLPVNNANALINNAANVVPRMKLLSEVSTIINGRFEHATTYFVARSLVKANEPWHVAAEVNLRKIIEHEDLFSRALDKMATNVQRAAA